MAAVDATKQPDLASRFGVKGYPTLKYFSKGEYKFDASHARQEDQIISFIKVILYLLSYRIRKHRENIFIFSSHAVNVE